ncbi:MAG: histidinol-phosphatase [Acidobacteria bacterium]|nr:histidinol-phosphatase [Acidobacteriota bacterium]MBV9476040.1 histidinol-phosphatase [Acidobacteriota bacterium]
MHADLALALSLADAADAIAMASFGSPSLGVRLKSDRSPVSDADEATERMIRERLAHERPHDGVAGEEFGTSGAAERRWIVDPIDGTKNYVRGVPVFASLLALEERGRVTIGVVSAPALARRWWAAAGEGAFCNGRAIHVSRVASLDAAFLSMTTFPRLARQCARVRDFGDFWAHMLVAEGAIDIAVDLEVAAWDMAAVQLIVEEAGGRFTDLRGDARYDGGSGVSTNGVLHDAALEHLR